MNEMYLGQSEPGPQLVASRPPPTWPPGLGSDKGRSRVRDLLGPDLRAHFFRLPVGEPVERRRPADDDGGEEGGAAPPPPRDRTGVSSRRKRITVQPSGGAPMTSPAR